MQPFSSSAAVEQQRLFISRRAALQSITAATCCCLSAALGLRAAELGGGHGSGHAGHGGAHWSYEGATGPEHWGELSPDFKACELGTQQAPIDIKEAVKAQFDNPLTLDYKAVGGKIVNNGHTIQVNTEPGCSFTISGKRYELIQYHFHHPSEHLVTGKPFDMEGHFVHKAADGSLAVIGTFIRAGAENAGMAPVFANLPAAGAGEKAFPAVDPSAMFPANRRYYRYMGSLTTPPCSEVVTWTVFAEPVEAPAAQIQKFAALFPNNARPVQNRNRRFLLKSN